jgi:hypothetical protein
VAKHLEMEMETLSAQSFRPEYDIYMECYGNPTVA